MADIADRANDRVEEQQSDALARHYRLRVDPAAAEFNGKDCVVCDEPIIEGRLKLGCIRCKDCQEDFEHARW